MTADLKTMGLSNTERELGALRAEVDHLKKDLDEVKQDVKEVLRALNEQSGGKKALWALLAAAGTLGGLISAAITVLFKFI